MARLTTKVSRFMTEYASLSRALSWYGSVQMAIHTARVFPAILRAGKLSPLDSAMNYDMTIRYRGTVIHVPVRQIDLQLKGTGDNPTFGNIREMYTQDCYLRSLSYPKPVGTVLDLGANRGMFSILALLYMKSDLVIGVEPNAVYEKVINLLLETNELPAGSCLRYTKFLTSPSIERQYPDTNVSIQTILQENHLDRIGMVKMDIEGHEKEVFQEPDWLKRVDSLAMEMHPSMVGDLSIIPDALRDHGFRFRYTDHLGNGTTFKDATFLYAQRA